MPIYFLIKFIKLLTTKRFFFYNRDHQSVLHPNEPYADRLEKEKFFLANYMPN